MPVACMIELQEKLNKEIFGDIEVPEELVEFQIGNLRECCLCDECMEWRKEHEDTLRSPTRCR